ncbi:MAG: AI-2E family transporter [Algisphaera sp.]
MGRGKSKRKQSKNTPAQKAKPALETVAPQLACPPCEPCPPSEPERATLLTEVDVCSNGADEPYIWQRRWFQILLASLVVFLVLAYVIPGAIGALYTVRSVLVPVLFGLALAYIVNPVLRLAQTHLKVGRLAGTISIMLLSLVVMAILMVTAVPLMYEQGKSLTLTVQDKYPTYINKVLERLDKQFPLPPDELSQAPDSSQLDFSQTDTSDASNAAPLESRIDVDADIAADPITDPATDAPQANISPPLATEEPAANIPLALETTPQTPHETASEDSLEIASTPQSDVAETAKPDVLNENEATLDKDASVIDTATATDVESLPLVEQVMQKKRTRRLLSLAVDKLRNLDGTHLTRIAMQSLDIGVGLVGSAISFTSYLALATVVVAFCFFFFSWKFDNILAWFEPFIPAKSRDHTLSMLRKMDLAVSSFVRGRLIQSLIMMTLLVFGWWLGNVPYWFLLGVLTGVLNLVPFLPAAGGLLAILLTVMTALANGGDFTWSLLLWPGIVFLVVQSLDGYVVEPIVQGKATNLDPLSVMLVVLVGGSLAGLLGMLLAIPLAACIKILMQELVLPKARAVAAEN